ncbi:MAG: methyltransferase domain-containing protein [Candidatus Omnitrophica bacterium]|nr:methyltransferase domain-containing protein [Candidatus Omnitrophota bacterium]MCA9437180.1 methyltransferase domain-containing protein [Candidatus Omnitrophota bacterium]MCB9767952.1 methyltransferase domain-containing protein [Candidatus Omnitrophota bacterium]
MRRCLQCAGLFENSDWICPDCGFHPEEREGIRVFAPDLAEINDGWSSDFSERMARDEEKHFWFVNRNRLIVWAIQRFFPEAADYFELGCGTGFVLSGVRKDFPHLRLSASDITLESLPFAKRRVPDADVFQMDGRKIPFTEEFDVIGAFDVLEHIEEDEAVLSEIHRAIRPGGGILITVPQHPFLWSVVDDFSYHKRRYTRKELVEKVARAGFKVSRCTSFVTVLLPLFLLSRLRMPKDPGDFDPASEYRIGDFSNGLLGSALALEQSLIRLGVNLPFGSSLFLAASRR